MSSMGNGGELIAGVGVRVAIDCALNSPASRE